MPDVDNGVGVCEAVPAACGTALRDKTTEELSPRDCCEAARPDADSSAVLNQPGADRHRNYHLITHAFIQQPYPII